jgi:hypothetical protein
VLSQFARWQLGGGYSLVMFAAYITRINTLGVLSCRRAIEMVCVALRGIGQAGRGSTDLDDVIISLYRYVPDYIVGLVQPKWLKKKIRP